MHFYKKLNQTHLSSLYNHLGKTLEVEELSKLDFTNTKNHIRITLGTLQCVARKKQITDIMNLYGCQYLDGNFFLFFGVGGWGGGWLGFVGLEIN